MSCWAVLYPPLPLPLSPQPPLPPSDAMAVASVHALPPPAPSNAMDMPSFFSTPDSTPSTSAPAQFACPLCGLLSTCPMCWNRQLSLLHPSASTGS
ncbi:uncharacterized protein LOC62_03G004277 [Vanrija pseudolonga]|uniref:Uncharacterized protein n=1 Tax=Vanrija pseudolonga TaxID=143232 RepID=A0AAF0Y6A7_9TREE|nr:hypothetical protein LOC62_03G004277 [Vanrija pseudolonga]